MTNCGLCDKKLGGHHILYLHKMRDVGRSYLCEDCYWNIENELSRLRIEYIKGLFKVVNRSEYLEKGAYDRP